MRMRLSLNSVGTPEASNYVTFPIYEFDFEQAIADGLVNEGELNKIIAGSDDKISYCDISIESPSLMRYLSTNMPHRPWDDGDILQSRISPYKYINNMYQVDPEYYNFETVSTTDQPVADAPDDWNATANYFTDTITQFTVDSVSYAYKRYINVRRNPNSAPAWEPGSKNYYKDVDFKCLKSLYTDTGYSFGVYRGSSDSGSGGPIMIAVGGDSSTISSSTARTRGLMYTTNATNGSLVQRYQYNDIEHEPHGYGGLKGLASINVNTYNATNEKKLQYLQGQVPGDAAANATLVFIHFKYNDPDTSHYQYDDNYYGAAIIAHDSLSTQSIPVSIRCRAFSGDFWGGSVISGGGGESNWGKPSTIAGGDGSFDSPSDNRGTGSGGDFTNPTDGIMKIRQMKLNQIMTSTVGIKYYGMRREVTESVDKMREIISWMFDTTHGFLTRYAQTLYNPMSGVLSLHLIPSDFYEPLFGVESHIIISGYDFTQEMQSTFQRPITAPILNTITHKHFDKFDLGKHFGAFPDFEPYTRCVLHLPYIGSVEIAANAVSQGEIAIDYMCDVMNGNVCAFVWCRDYKENCTYKYTATGNCAYNIPMYNMNQDFSGIGKIANGAVSLLGMAKSPISGGIAAAQGILSGMWDLANMEQSTSFAGTLAGNVGLLNDLVVWLEVIRPVWVQPEEYQNFEGVPLQMSGTIETIAVDNVSLSGYTEISKIELDNVNASDAEKSEIERLLQSGVWIDRERF